MEERCSAQGGVWVGRPIPSKPSEIQMQLGRKGEKMAEHILSYKMSSVISKQYPKIKHHLKIC